MIDIHCHILPELDDGAKSLAEAALMARMALFDGITTVVASAHMTPGIYDNTPDQIVEEANRIFVYSRLIFIICKPFIDFIFP